jgi:hypothetical protein
VPIATCGGIGTSKARDAGQRPVTATAGELATLRDGTYVVVDATLRHVASDELPVGHGAVALAHGTSVYAVQGTNAVYVAAKKGALAADRPVHFEGRLCSTDAYLACSIDEEGVKIFLLEEGRRVGRAPKLVTRGASPSENVVEAFIGLGIAGVLLLLLGGALAVILRGRRKPFVFVERIVPVREGLEPARVGDLLGMRFRVAQTTPQPMVFLTGVAASRAQLVGAFRPDDFPQRVEIWLEPGVGYRQARARVRVSEIFAQPTGPLPQLLPAVSTALEATMQRVLAALDVRVT